MQQVNEALNDVKDLYRKLTGNPAPEIEPPAFIPFPPGVDPVDFALREADDLKRYSERLADRPAPIAWVPRADTFIGKDAWTYLVEIPGLKREDLDVKLVGTECIVRGERKMPDTVSDIQPLNVERALGQFERRFPIPPGATAEGLTASYAEGVLELRVEIKDGGKIPEQPVEVR